MPVTLLAIWRMLGNARRAGPPRRNITRKDEPGRRTKRCDAYRLEPETPADWTCAAGCGARNDHWRAGVAFGRSCPGHRLVYRVEQYAGPPGREVQSHAHGAGKSGQRRARTGAQADGLDVPAIDVRRRRSG